VTTHVTQPETPPDSESADTEARIFDAALRVFARKGKDGARLQEIADEAGIHRPLLHYYFRTKQQLYEAVAAHMFGQFLDSFNAPSPEGPFADVLKAFIEHYVDNIRAHQDMAKWMVAENMAGNPFLGERLAAAFETEGSPQRHMEEAILKAIDRGEIRPVNPKQLMLTIVSACVFFFAESPCPRRLRRVRRGPEKARFRGHLLRPVQPGGGGRCVNRRPF